jgi:ectoine hydroxylase-related dioxygenase (phytanoyl-CoA dioxygenase family)
MTATQTGYDIAAARDQLYSDGITALHGAFSPEWAARMRHDIEVAFADARSREGGAVGRGPNRYYVEIHPEQLSGFLELISHRWVRAVCEEILGPDYLIVELGFDVPLPGAKNQPWHRDFPSPLETYRDHQLTSLAFNLTAVDTAPEMGPFQIAVGTQWEDGLDFDHQMFPDRSTWSRYHERAVRKLPKAGDISARSALTLHRGTENVSAESRPVLVLGMVAPHVVTEGAHDLILTKEFFRTLPAAVRGHLRCTELVDALAPMIQRHDIEGLKMGG